jgi:branched-chain amino acid transport system permease protein
MFNLDNLLQLVVSGISVGMIYGVIAFGYQLTFATSRTLNFGQGEALMLGALFGLTTINFMIGRQLGNLTSYLIMLPIVCAFGLLQGAVVERLGVRQAIKTKSDAGWIMATIALGIIFRNLAENIWGRDALKFPSPLPEGALSLGPARIQPMEIAIVVGALAMMLAVELFNRTSIYGKAVVATANDRDAAGLMGINTGRVITFSYALSSMAAAFAGVLVAPVTLTGPTMGAVLGLKAFAVAIIGGLSSGLGVVVGGLILGITENLTGYYISTGYKDVPGLVLLLLVLSLKPSGLFGKAAIKKV